MARKPSAPPPLPPSIPSSEAALLLEEQTAKLKQIFDKRPIDSQAVTAWESFTRELLIKSFGSASQNVDDVLYANAGPLRMNMSPQEIEQRRVTKISNQLALLGSCIDQLKLEARLQQPKQEPEIASRADLLEEIFVTFSNDATLLDAEQFAIDHQDKIDAYDSLLRDGTLNPSGGKLEFSLRSYVGSKFWPKDETLLNQLLPIMKEMYSEKKSGLYEVSDFITLIERKGIMLKVRPIEIERALRLFNRVGLLGGHNAANDDHGVPRIKSFSVSQMILRPKTIADQLKFHLPSAATISSAMTIGADLTAAAPAKDNKKVFIVHGHDAGLREDVARLIVALGLEPIILHEKANQGQTLVEKFLRHSDVGFALVVMTADDLGKAKTEDAARPRARQNVVFEWGYFVGKLGRERVCALYEQGIDLPSDLHGIVYIPLDATGHWRLGLLKELKAAGYSVDANKLLE